MRDIRGSLITRGTLEIEKMEKIEKMENFEKFPSQCMKPRES